MVRCTGITLAGKQCKKSCKDNKFCWLHTCCGICIEPVRNSIELDCGHKFCEGCINEWICVSTNYNCPTCRNSISEKIKSNAVVWGIKNFVLLHYYNLIIDLSRFDPEFQELFMFFTGIEKNKKFSSDKIIEIRKEIQSFLEFKENWNLMFNKENMVHSHHFYINKSREKNEKGLVFFTFI